MRDKTKELKTSIVDVLHKHYYPTLHEAIADCTLVECAEEVIQLCAKHGLKFVDLDGKTREL